MEYVHNIKNWLKRKADENSNFVIYYVFFVLTIAVAFIFSNTFVDNRIRIYSAIIVLVIYSILHFLLKIEYRVRYGYHPVSLIVSMVLGILLYKKIRWNNVDASQLKCIGLEISIILFLFCIINIVLVYVEILVRRILLDKVAAVDYICSATCAAWFVFVFLPVNDMTQNSSDYMISFWQLFMCCIVAFVVACLASIFVFLMVPRGFRKALQTLVLSFLICSYIQYMFMNGVIPRINGSRFDLANHMSESVLNAIIWLMIFVVVIIGFVLCKNKIKLSKTIRGIAICLFSMQLIVMISSLLLAPKSVFKFKDYIIDDSEQFTVSLEGDVIIFVLDALDNNYIKELLDEDVDAFDGLEDFTLYTNTCSVYDNTYASMTQMFSGERFDNEPYNYAEFYKRMHDDNYKVHFYNYEYDPNSAIMLESYIDNYSLIEKDGKSKAFKVDYEKIMNSSYQLSMYQVLPDFFKSIVNINSIDYRNVISRGEGDTAVYTNDDFLNNLDLKINKSGEKYLIVQHLLGAHIPENPMEGTKKGLEIVRRTVQQLKEKDLYDKVTIIVTADHGFQYETIPDEPCRAATPMFMIKKAGESHDSMKYSAAPIYHTDLLATILDCEGLYDYDNDKDVLGTSIFNIGENDSRERIWVDTINEINKYHVYTFTGDTKDLEDAVEHNRYDEISF